MADHRETRCPHMYKPTQETLKDYLYWNFIDGPYVIMHVYACKNCYEKDKQWYDSMYYMTR